MCHSGSTALRATQSQKKGYREDTSHNIGYVHYYYSASPYDDDTCGACGCSNPTDALGTPSAVGSDTQDDPGTISALAHLRTRKRPHVMRSNREETSSGRHTATQVSQIPRREGPLGLPPASQRSKVSLGTHSSASVPCSPITATKSRTMSRHSAADGARPNCNRRHLARVRVRCTRTA